MSSSFSSSLRIEMPADGDQSGTWGQTINTNLGTLIEGAISGFATVSVTSAAQAFTALNGVADQARMAMLRLTTTTTAPFAVYAPPAPKQYTIWNASAYPATIYNSTVTGNTTAAGAGATIPAGAKLQFMSDGTHMYTVEAGAFPYGMVLGANGLGLGVTPLAKLHSKSIGELLRLETTQAGGNGFLSFWDSSNRLGYIGYGSASADLYITNERPELNGNIYIGPSGAQGALTVDRAANVGLSAAPSAWQAGRPTLEIGGATQPTIAFNGNTTNGGAIWTNAFYDGVNRYKANGPATRIQTGGGLIEFYTAPSGTAGAPITFTQVMSLSVSGAIVPTPMVAGAAANKGYVDTAVASALPPGVIMDYGGETAPAGWLECDGSSRSRAAYPGLFAAIGTLHGSADANSFNLPNHMGRFKRARANGNISDPDRATRTAAAAGGVTGDRVGTLQDGQIQGHNHINGITVFNNGDGVSPYGPAQLPAGATFHAGQAGATTNSSLTSTTGGNQTNPINVYVMSIIKT